MLYSRVLMASGAWLSASDLTPFKHDAVPADPTVTANYAKCCISRSEVGILMTMVERGHDAQLMPCQRGCHSGSACSLQRGLRLRLDGTGGYQAQPVWDMDGPSTTRLPPNSRNTASWRVTPTLFRRTTRWRLDTSRPCSRIEVISLQVLKWIPRRTSCRDAVAIVPCLNAGKHQVAGTIADHLGFVRGDATGRAENADASRAWSRPARTSAARYWRKTCDGRKASRLQNRSVPTAGLETRLGNRRRGQDAASGHRSKPHKAVAGSELSQEL